MPCMVRAYAKGSEEIADAVKYSPTISVDKYGPLLDKPDSPYVARISRNKLYFLSKTLDEQVAKEKKSHLDMMCSEPEWRLDLDHTTFTAQWIIPATKEVVYTFDKDYAKIFYGHLFNSIAGEEIVKEHPSGDHRTVKYDLKAMMGKRQENMLIQRATECINIDCNTQTDCLDQTENEDCTDCVSTRTDPACALGLPNATGGGGPHTDIS